MPLVFAMNTVLFPQLLASIGDDCIGIVGSGPYTGTIDTPINNAYVGALISKYHQPPTAEMVAADIAFSMYLEAVKATNGDTSPAKIVDALYNVKIDTPAGVRSFTSDGIGIGDMYIMEVAKLPDRYDWVVLEKYSQVVMDVPE
jgi:ABC-type branched-subunit amino acid transport system substrate-binding protein